MRKLFLIPLLFLSLFSFGQIDSLFTVVGTHEWVVPNSVTSIEVFAVQGGQGSGRENGGDGGETAGVTSLMVVPGETLYITVGDGGDRNSFGATGTDGDHSSIMRGMAIIFSSNGTGSDSHHLGGDGGSFQIISTPCGGLVGGAGGGGAGGYTGNGGDGGGGGGTTGLAGAGGAGGGGGGALTYSTVFGSYVLYGFRGGGVGILGEGASGGSSTGIGNDGSGGNFGYGGFGISNTKTIVGCFNSSVATADNGGQGALRITYTAISIPTLPIPPTWQSNDDFFIYDYKNLQIGLHSIWENDETSGTVSGDVQGNTNGTLLNVGVDSVGQINRAYGFNKTSSADSLGVGIYDSDNTGSISIVFRATTNTSDAQTLFGAAQTNDANPILDIRITTTSSSNTLVIVYRDAAGAGLGALQGSTNLVIDTWYHAVITCNGTTTKMYLDGIEETVSVWFGANVNGKWFNDVGGTLTYSIGGLFGNTTTGVNFFGGLIDQTIISSQVWTQDQITDLNKRVVKGQDNRTW